MSQPPNEPASQHVIPLDYAIPRHVKRDQGVATICIWAIVVLVIGGGALWAAEALKGVFDYRAYAMLFGGAALLVLTVMGSIQSLRSRRLGTSQKVLSFFFTLLASLLIIVGLAGLIFLGLCAAALKGI